MTVLLAIDPSTRETGLAIFSKGELAKGRAEPGASDETPSSPGKSRDEMVQVHAPWKLVYTGVIVADRRPWRVEIPARIKGIESALDSIVEAWWSEEVVRGQPSPRQLPHHQEGIEALSRALERWTRGHNLPLYSHSLHEIREAIIGRASGAKEELAYAVMTRWGLLGEGKTTHEWNAIAVGDYHLGKLKVGLLYGRDFEQ